MKKIYILPVLIFLFAACSPAPVGTQVWFDKPLPGSKYAYAEIQPIEIILHAADPAGITQVEVFANGISIALLQGMGPTEPFAQFSTSWLPLSPGKYTLQARAKGGAGNWSEFATTIVIITDQALRDAPTATIATVRVIGLSPTNTLASTSIFTDTPTPTFTPTSTRIFTSTYTLIPTRYISPTNTPFPTRAFTATFTPPPTREPLPSDTPIPREPTPTATGRVQPSPTPTAGR